MPEDIFKLIDFKDPNSFFNVTHKYNLSRIFKFRRYLPKGPEKGIVNEALSNENIEEPLPEVVRPKTYYQTLIKIKMKISYISYILMCNWCNLNSSYDSDLYIDELEFYIYTSV